MYLMLDAMILYFYCLSPLIGNSIISLIFFLNSVNSFCVNFSSSQYTLMVTIVHYIFTVTHLDLFLNLFIDLVSHVYLFPHLYTDHIYFYLIFSSLWSQFCFAHRNKLYLHKNRETLTSVTVNVNLWINSIQYIYIYVTQQVIRKQ